FDAPHVAIVCMEQHFKLGVALDVGMYVQTLMLALWARAVASCAQASLRMFPAIIRRELGIPKSLRILCGVSFGYERHVRRCLSRLVGLGRLRISGHVVSQSSPPAVSDLDAVDDPNPLPAF